MMKNGLLVLLKPLLVIYAPIELSRVIVEWGLAPKFILELVFIWLFYAIFVVLVISQGRMRRRAKKELNSSRQELRGMH